jgi:hypothetical protein
MGTRLSVGGCPKLKSADSLRRDSIRVPVAGEGLAAFEFLENDLQLAQSNTILCAGSEPV